MTEAKSNIVQLPSKETWRIKKNVAVITVALMIHFTAVNGAVNLQSSINAEAGTAALVAMFTGVLISNMFLTSVVIKLLGTKWTVCFSFMTYIPFILFQIHPRFSTLVPAGLLMGLGSGMKLCAKSTYIAVLAEAHSKLTKIPAATVLLSFSGFFFMVVHMSQFWGNLISSLVLSSANNASVTTVNETMIPQICGSNFLSHLHAAKALPTQPPEKIFTLAGIYFGCVIGAILITAIALDSMKRYQFCRKPTDSLSGIELLAVTIKHLADPNQRLLLAINIFVGLQQGFFSADFTASFVSCAIGTGSLGYVMMTHGSSNIVGCFVNPYFAKLLGRLQIMCFALFVHGGLLVTLLTWHPHAEDYYVMLFIAVLWGLCDSIWAVQINTYYGVLFRGKEEAAFSNLGLWEGVGYIVSFALSSYVRTCYKVYLLLFNLMVGFTGYALVEYRQNKRDNQKVNKTFWIKPKPEEGEPDELDKMAN